MDLRNPSSLTLTELPEGDEICFVDDYNYCKEKGN